MGNIFPLFKRLFDCLNGKVRRKVGESGGKIGNGFNRPPKMPPKTSETILSAAIRRYGGRIDGFFGRFTGALGGPKFCPKAGKDILDLYDYRLTSLGNLNNARYKGCRFWTSRKVGTFRRSEAPALRPLPRWGVVPRRPTKDHHTISSPSHKIVNHSSQTSHTLTNPPQRITIDP